MVAFLIEGGTKQDRRSLEGHHLISPSLPVAAIIQKYNNTNTTAEGAMILERGLSSSVSAKLPMKKIQM
jgi:hypothetical protein